MAINKRKILQSAQKHLQKGALEKALKDYQTLLKADPRDANLRLKIGDIELKRGRRDEAVAAYVKVAEAFMKDGFDAKAVALYKQITKIDEKRIDVLVPLADLYQRMGLQSDAMVTLQTAADAHYRDGHKDEALDLLRRMAALDPSNTNSRLKVADLLRQEDRIDEAISEYEEVAAELERQGAEEDRIRVLVRLLELAPERVDLMASVARSRIDGGKFNAAEKTATMMTEQQPDEPDAWLLLGEARARLGQGAESADAYRRAAEIHRERGNDDVARDITQRFVAPATMGDPGAGDAADDHLLGGSVEDLAGPADDPGFDPNGLSLSRRLGESSEDCNEGGGASLPPLPQVDVSESGFSPDVDGDPEQLLAEASVYLRYGKHDRAIESLRSIVRQDPTCVAAFAKLGEALEATGQTEHAITAYERGAQVAAQSSDATAFEDLRQSLAALDSERAEALAAVEAEAAPAAQVFEPEFELELEPEPADAPDEQAATMLAGPDAEFEIDLDAELEGSADDDELVVSAEIESDGPAAAPELSDDEIEIELSLDEEDDAIAEGEELVPDFDLSGEMELAVEEATLEPAEPELADSESVDSESTDSELADSESVDSERVDSERVDAEPADVGSIDDESLMDVSGVGADAIGIEISDSAPDLGLEEDEDAMAGSGLAGEGMEESQREVSLQSPEEVAGASASATTPAQMAEDLEEADFFYQQGMMDEARMIYERILAVAPGHPAALLRVGEIEAAAGGVPDDASVEIDGEQAAVEASEPFDLDGDDVFDDPENEEDEQPEGEVELASPEAADAEFGGDPDDDTGRIRGAVEQEVAGDEDGPGESEQAGLEGAEPAADSLPAKPAEAEVTAPVTLEAPLGEEEGFDLAAHLSDAFDLEDAAGPGAALAASTEDEGFEEVFAAFKHGVEGALEEGDFEAHYDLGIAYKEMGLFEDAIGEFRAAMGAEVRRLPSLHMMGLCAFELGRLIDAVAHLEQALGLPGVPEEQQLGLRFDLGRAYVGVGDVSRARAAFEAVQALDPEFPDVGEQLAALDEAPEPEDIADEPSEADAEAFENFDDLIADGPSGLEEEPEEAPAYESFDDFLQGDDEADEDEPDAAQAVDPEPVAETADDREPSVSPKKPGRRKKKISFV